MQSMIMARKRSACRLLSIRTFAPISKVTESIHVHVHVYLVKSETSLMIQLVEEALKLYTGTRMLLVAEKDGQKNKCMDHC